MLKIVREEKVETKKVEIELELTYVDGVLQEPARSFTVGDIDELLNPSVEDIALPETMSDNAVVEEEPEVESYSVNALEDNVKV